MNKIEKKISIISYLPIQFSIRNYKTKYKSPSLRNALLFRFINYPLFPTVNSSSFFPPPPSLLPFLRFALVRFILFFFSYFFVVWVLRNNVAGGKNDGEKKNMKRKILKNKLAQTLMIEVTYIFKIYRINRKYCGDRKILMGFSFSFFVFLFMLIYTY